MEVPVAIVAGRRNDAASTEPFGASRETRANGVEAATKNKKETLLFRLSSDAILATLLSTRNERVPPAISL